MSERVERSECCVSGDTSSLGGGGTGVTAPPSVFASCFDGSAGASDGSSAAFVAGGWVNSNWPTGGLKAEKLLSPFLGSYRNG
jgi:hypothetical protein